MNSEATPREVDVAKQTEPQKSGLATASLILGLVSFIPLVGVLLGILAIIIGVLGISQIKKKTLGGKRLARAVIVLGILGIVFTLVVYGSLYYFGFVSETGPFAELKPKLNQQLITNNVGALELYKKKPGNYPTTLEEAIEDDFSILPLDAYSRSFYYEAKQAGQSYELRSLGADGQYGTDDDTLVN